MPSQPILLPSVSLCQRELVRFLRQRHRIVGALATPIVFWILLGTGMGQMEYFYPGTVVMILLFTAIFSTISIIEDRREGFLQSVLVAPISPMAIVLGKVLGGAVLAFGQGLLLLAAAPLVGVHFTLSSLALALMAMALMSIWLTALGFCIAWRMSSTQGFHAIMNLFLMPLWFLSGALFELRSGMWPPMRWVMQINPLTYGLAALREALTPHKITSTLLPAIGWNLTITGVVAVVMLVLASRLALGRISADLK